MMTWRWRSSSFFATVLTASSRCCSLPAAAAAVATRHSTTLPHRITPLRTGHPLFKLTEWPTDRPTVQVCPSAVFLLRSTLINIDTRRRSLLLTANRIAYKDQNSLSIVTTTARLKDIVIVCSLTRFYSTITGSQILLIWFQRFFLYSIRFLHHDHGFVPASAYV